ncbi:MAG: hypothetical protein ACRD1E_01055 [Terriglobales bacterium]
MPLNPPQPLTPEREITRFLHHHRDFNAASMLVKPAPFMPTSRRETSIAEITGLAEAEIWRLAAFTLNPTANRTEVRARADLAVAEAHEQDLRCMRDDAGFAGHGNLLGWPSDKERQKEIALELARAARLALPNAPIRA